MFKEKYAQGKELRDKVSRSSHSSWKVAADRPPVEKMIELSNYDRLPDLIPIRHFRMTKSPTEALAKVGFGNWRFAKGVLRIG